MLVFNCLHIGSFFNHQLYKNCNKKKWRYKTAIKIIISYAKITIKSKLILPAIFNQKDYPRSGDNKFCLP